VPCCASHSIYTSTKPVTSNAGSCKVPAAAAPPHLLKHCSNTSNETRTERTYLHGDDEFTTLVMNRTGCRDGAMATEALIESSGDMDQAVDYLLSIALFVGSGDEENLSKTISQNTMDMS
ncbi:unnamed protein product, partial [Gongylonema pulchrum]|uniref:UBA domain-containing protein n=1 Tax=Gongylonema pulchrum TaxID=637853 RepID=A0A183EM69_9BILA